MADRPYPELLPCPFCLTSNVRIHPRTCDRKSPYDARDRAFPVARCACGVSVDGKDWGDEITAIEAWNRRAAPAPGGEDLKDAERYRHLREIGIWIDPNKYAKARRVLDRFVDESIADVERAKP
ncbi:Lar family restriction alleviation protein [Hydrogenophaga sp.]|uniref:Lar family restriction alleviation protein n=1 Tax=Hydrogenophaga sp. TaxID=1904254 RepID=UPI003F71F9A0